MGNTNLQLAVYSDRVVDPALTGVGDASAEAGEVLPELYSETFTYRGKGLDARGMRVVLQRKLGSESDSYSGLWIRRSARSESIPLSPCRTRAVTLMCVNRHTAAAKFSGVLPGAKTRWIASYRWISGQALTPVDMFNESAGQADPFLNIFLRQPIPGTGFLPCHMDAVVDVRNLLAQGYVPVHGSGWPHPLPGAIGAHGSRRRGVYVLDLGLRTSDLETYYTTFSIFLFSVNSGVCTHFKSASAISAPIQDLYPPHP